MRVLSLFDGMSCGMIAMINAGIQVDEYYAYEIDKYAIQTSKHNFPQIIQCGDIFKGDFTQYKDFDYLIGGSPCQHWSIAQSPDRRETVASGIGWELFSQYFRALNEAKPKFFIYENNKSMSNEIRKSISETFGFEPVCINSALVSAQNRQRLYWVGKRNEDGTYSRVDIEQPEDKGIVLRDVLDGLTDREKGRAVIASIGRTTYREYFKKHQGNMSLEPVNTTASGKAGCLRATYYKEGIRNMVANTIDRKTCVAIPVLKELSEREMDYMVRDHAERRWNFAVKPSECDKAPCVTANIHKGVPYNVCAVPIQVGALPRPNGELSTSQGFRIYDIDAKSVTLKGNAGGAGGKTGLYAIPIEFQDGVPTKAISCYDGKTYQVYQVKDNQITVKGKQYPIKLIDGYYIIRKLTVYECMRLQTVPEWYEFPVSNTQAYKLLGNGWTCDVITHLINATKGEDSQ